MIEACLTGMGGRISLHDRCQDPIARDFTNLDRSVLYFVRVRPGVGSRFLLHDKCQDPIARDFIDLVRDVSFLFGVRPGGGCRISLQGKCQDPIARDFEISRDTSTNTGRIWRST